MGSKLVLVTFAQNTIVLQDALSGKWLLFTSPRCVLEARKPGDVLPVLREVESETRRGRYAAGCVAYEAAAAFDPALETRRPGDFPLAWFGIFDAPQEIVPPQAPAESADISWESGVTESEYHAALAEIKRQIAAGNTYEVNYSFRLRARFTANPWTLFARMTAAQEHGYPVYIDMGSQVVCSASPELFFSLDGTRLISKPMKGTAARGLCLEEDRRRAQWLKESEKNLAENLMIVDMVRNDLGRIATPGSVSVPRLFEVEKYPTVWQMTSTVQCHTQAGLAQIFTALFPPASITGAPKVQTMRLISKLEIEPRQVYTGAAGYVAPNRRAQFNVAIRTATIDRGRRMAEYGIGSGIVWDSESGEELKECFAKARVAGASLPAFSLLETLRWSPGEGFHLLKQHLARLRDSAEYFARTLDTETLVRRLCLLTARLGPGEWRVRVLVPVSGEPQLEANLLDDRPSPYRVGLAQNPVCSEDVFLYHKTTWRKVYDDALASRPDCADLLLQNERGEVTESCRANFAAHIDGRWLTPPVGCGLLCGTERARLLAQGQLLEARLRVEDLRRARKFALFNSVRGFWEIQLELE